MARFQHAPAEGAVAEARYGDRVCRWSGTVDARHRTEVSKLSYHALAYDRARTDDVDRGSGEPCQLGGGCTRNPRALARTGSARRSARTVPRPASSSRAARSRPSRSDHAASGRPASSRAARSRRPGRPVRLPRSTASRSRPGRGCRRPRALGRVQPVRSVTARARWSRWVASLGEPCWLAVATWCLRCTEAARAAACRQAQRTQAPQASRCRPPSPPAVVESRG